jgi:penicillin amidase
VQTLGYQRTMQWFPVFPPDAQHPYDPGPYRKHGLAPLPSQQSPGASELGVVADVARQFAALPPFTLHQVSNSNSWAVDATKTASRKPLLAGDPHLDQTLPAIWHQLEADAPDYHFSGVTIPGIPIILIGHNSHCAWSLTSV